MTENVMEISDYAFLSCWERSDEATRGRAMQPLGCFATIAMTI